MLASLGGLWNKAELIWSGLAKPVSCNGLSETHGLVWSSLVIWNQELVWSGGLLAKIGSICGKEKENLLPNSLLLKMFSKP